MSNVISPQESEFISDLEQEIYNNISDAIVKYILDKKWLNSKEISDAIISLCNEINNENIDRDMGSVVLKRLVADYVESELDSMLDKHFMNQKYPQFDFGRLSFSEKLLKGLA